LSDYTGIVVSTDFIIVKPNDDPVMRLRTAFPDMWSDLLDCADPDTPHLMYSAFADLLLQDRDNENLWSRAYRLFDEIAERGDASWRELLGEAFDRLWDSDKREDVEQHLGSTARTLFRRSEP
jgi:hypothetical protein